MSDSLEQSKKSALNFTALGSIVPESGSTVPLLDFRSFAAFSIGQLPRASLLQLTIVDICAYCIKKYGVSSIHFIPIFFIDVSNIKPFQRNLWTRVILFTIVQQGIQTPIYLLTR